MVDVEEQHDEPDDEVPDEQRGVAEEVGLQRAFARVDEPQVRRDEPFPEPAATPFGIYEPAKAYLHSEDVHWSWGAMRGRPEDWAATIAGKPAAEVVSAARSEAFTGVLLDRVALGSAAAATEADFRAATGTAPEQLPGGRWVFFRL